LFYLSPTNYHHQIALRHPLKYQEKVQVIQEYDEKHYFHIQYSKDSQI